MTRGHRSTRSIHALSPATTRALVSQFARRNDDDAGSASSESPDSMYSNTSPVFVDQAFEFDTYSRDLEVEERDEDELESLMGSMDGREDDAFGGQGWSRWPEAGLGGEMGWTPPPKSGSRKGSIISISPRGSISASARAASTSGRRPSTPHSKLRYNGEERRDSDPSLLGFDLARRRSSGRSISSSRRRSSAVSYTSSVMDPLEDARLRTIASMGQLGQRFSEVVEVTMASESGSSYRGSDVFANHPSLARAALQSPWSPDTFTDDDEDDSEIMTAPYIPTPDMPFRRPLLLSNFPLPSAVRDELPYDTPLDTLPGMSVASPSPVPPRRPQVIPQALLATPPPPARPLHILRGRQRPALPRAATDYQFPPRSEGVPAGAGPPRPVLSRAISTPFFSTPQKTQPIAMALAHRTAGNFPFARSAALGNCTLGTSPLGISPRSTSPWKTSTRRRSLTTDPGEPRQGSLAGDLSELRRSSLEVRRMSMGSRRPSFAEHRMSIVNGTCAPPRRLSNDTRRSSIVKGTTDSRRSSNGSVYLRRDSGPETRRPSADRRSSQASRKSSVVSFGEYGYLAPQIVVDTPTPALAGTPSMSSTVTPAAPTPPARLRPNAPSSIALPLPFTAALPANSPALTPSGTSRFNPLETFLGMSSGGPHPWTPTPGSADLFTPRGDRANMFDVTPKPSPTGVMDRPRPITSPEFRESFPLSPRRWQGRISPNQTFKTADAGSGSSDTCVENGITSGSSDTHVDSEQEIEPSPVPTGPQFGIVRKAVPQLTAAEEKYLASASASPVPSESESMERDRATRGHQRNYYRRGAVELFTPSDATLPRPPLTRRAVSVQGHTMRTDVIRPVVPRQATQEVAKNEPPRPGQSSPGIRYPRTATVTFAAEATEARPLSRPPIARASSASTLSRFFHGRSKSSSHAPVIAAPADVKPVRPALRPRSMEGWSSSSGSDNTLVEIRGMLRKAGEHPRSPQSPRDVSALVARAVG